MSTTNTPKSSKKSKTKSTKDERYEDMLKKIDLSLDQEKPKNLVQESAFNDDDDSNAKSFKPGAVSLLDLMSSLENNDKAPQNTSILKTHVTEMIKKPVFEEAPSTWKQEELDRKANYEIIKKDAKKWEGIIKRNREAAHLDLTNKNNDKFRINSNIVHNLSKSTVENRVEAKLKELNMLNEDDFLKEERDMLRKLNPDEAKRREDELTKHRNLMFYQELKQKRISKIKSKLYHKIKNKKERRLQEKLMANMDESDPMAQLKELEELEKKRAQERVSLRHKNKSKYAKNVLRYGDKKESKQSVNDLAQLRREILRKINPDQKDRLQQQIEEEEFQDDDMDDNQFKKKLIQEIEDHLRREENDEEDDGIKKQKLSGFMKKLAEQKKVSNRREAEALLERLRNTDNLDDFKLSEDEEEQQKEGDMEEENPQGEESKKNQKKDFQSGGRKKFHKEEKNTGSIQVEDYKKNKKTKETKEILDSFIENPDEHPEIAINAPTTKSLNLLAGFKTQEDKSAHLGRLEPKDLLFASSNETKNEDKSDKKKDSEKKKKENESADKDDLVSGLNFGSMKQKYNKSKNSEFLGDQIEKFNEENKQDLYNDLANFQVVSSNIYDEDFNKEKEELYEDELPEEKKPLRGWGAWAGQGIKEKKVDPQIELMKKIQKIEELKRQRRDGKLDHVILHEERNKLVTKYLIQDLPHPYKNAAQFDYVQGLAVGPEWNSMKNHQKLIKPKVITKAGEIINPIQAPKKPRKK